MQNLVKLVQELTDLIESNKILEMNNQEYTGIIMLFLKSLGGQVEIPITDIETMVKQYELMLKVDKEEGIVAYKLVEKRKKEKKNNEALIQSLKKMNED